MIKKFSILFWNELIYGGHLFSLGAASIVFASALVLKQHVSLPFLFVVYLGIQSTYLYNRYKEFKTDKITNLARSTYLQNFYQLIPYAIIFEILLILGFFALTGNLSSLFVAIVLLLIGLSYTFYFKKITKTVPGFKNAYVAFSWSLLDVFWLFYYSLPINLAFILIFIFVFSRVFLHEVYSDIKDKDSDHQKGLKTFPIVLGDKKLNQVLTLINAITILPVLVGIFLKIFPLYAAFLVLVLPYSWLYQQERRLNINKEFLYNVIVDSEPLLWTIFLLVGKLIFK